MTVDIQVVAENLAELLTNSNEIASKAYDILINPTPMDVAIQVYNDQNQLVTINIPNVAKVRSVAKSGVVDPEGNVSGVKGTLYVNTAYGSVYVKTDDTTETTGWQLVLTQASIDQLLTQYVQKTTTVNGKALSSSISLTALDVDALPTSTAYGSSLSFSNNSINLVDQNSNILSSVTLGTTGANKDLSNLSATGEAHFADSSLTNLTSTGEAHFSDATLSNTTSLSSAFKALVLEALYPVGSVVLGITSTCPAANLGGTWTLVASGKALWTGDGSNGGTTIAAGLPNITGLCMGVDDNSWSYEGAFYQAASGGTSGGTENGSRPGFDASRSNSIYGNSTTVQPPAYVVNAWKRTA